MTKLVTVVVSSNRAVCNWSDWGTMTFEDHHITINLNPGYTFLRWAHGGEMNQEITKVGTYSLILDYIPVEDESVETPVQPAGEFDPDKLITLTAGGNRLNWKNKTSAINVSGILYDDEMLWAATVETGCTVYSGEGTANATHSLTYNNKATTWCTTTFEATPAEGYIFKGWIVGQNGTTPTVITNPVSVKRSTTNIYYKAVFERDPNYVTFDTYSGDNPFWIMDTDEGELAIDLWDPNIEYSYDGTTWGREDNEVWIGSGEKVYLRASGAINTTTGLIGTVNDDLEVGGELVSLMPNNPVKLFQAATEFEGNSELVLPEGWQLSDIL